MSDGNTDVDESPVSWKVKSSEALVDGSFSVTLSELSSSSRVIPASRDFDFHYNLDEFKRPIDEIAGSSQSDLETIGNSEQVWGNSMKLLGEVDEDDAEDWLFNVNDEFHERFDISVDEFDKFRMKEDEIGPPVAYSGDGFQRVYGKKKEPVGNVIAGSFARNMTRGSMIDVKVAERDRNLSGKANVPFHVPTIKKPQEEYIILVNNASQPFEHDWLEWSEDGQRFMHPLEKLSVIDFVGKDVNELEPVKPLPLEETPFKFVQEVKDLKALVVKLHSVDEFAVVLEHYQYRSSQGLTCLMQISTRTEDYIVDTFRLRVHIGPYLRKIFKDPKKKKVMHGADRDIIWLQRDFGIYVCNLFDTAQASRVLNLERNSLEFLLQHFCGVTANKEYAREDTHYLLYIYDVIRVELQSMEKDYEHNDSPLLEVYKRSYDVCTQIYEKELLTENSYLHVYGLQAAGFKAAQLAIVAGLCEWRKSIAHVEDESTGYVLPKKVLLEIAKEMPASVGTLRQMLKSKHPYIERNVETVVSVIRQSMQNCEAFKSGAQPLKIASPGHVLDNTIERKNMYINPEDVPSLSLKEMFFQVESNTASLIMPTCSSSSDREEPLIDEYISDEDYEGYMNQHESYMVVPSRSAILHMLPADLRSSLKEEVTVTITSECAKIILGEERFKLVLETKPVSFLRLSDSLGEMDVVWRTGGLAEHYILSPETRAKFKNAKGYIRNQKHQKLCWGYSLSDSISASRVLQGLDKEFMPLCVHYLCERVSPAEFRRALVPEDKGHCCYGADFRLGASYVKLHGIPIERPGHRDFVCSENRPIAEDEELFQVEDIFHYHTLEQALVRLKTCPVVASLATYPGWDKREIFRGPLKKRAKYEEPHSVLIIDCRKIDGEMVAVCKSSNGTSIGFDGYILVSLEVMFIKAGATRKAGKNNCCHIEPQHLLFDFYSIDAKRGSSPPRIQKDPKEVEKNSVFKVDMNYGDLLRVYTSNH